MKKYIRSILFLACVSFALNSQAQFNPKDVCTVRDGRICFKLDQRWSDKQKKEVSKRFSLDSSLIAGAFKGKSVIVFEGQKWEVNKISASVIELSKTLEDKPAKMLHNDVLMVDDNLFNISTYSTIEKADYGINNFTPGNIFHYSNGEALFYLPGNKNARQVVLSGSFNNWSTSQIQMNRTSTGWFVKLKLAAGKYQYKYILDGKWISDPYNKLQQDDKNGGHNSVVFCYNYCFKLKGYASSPKVSVAGSFNNWNINELKMYIRGGEWILPIYLRPGTHAYKFAVDGKWMTDPANKSTRPDGRGNVNSFLGIGDTLIFRLKGYTTAKKAMLAGEFNGWNQGELRMDKTPRGWELQYTLGPGNYQYKFIVDGKWITDPANPYAIGKGNTQNSWLAFKANHSFILNKFQDAREVIVTGSFNDWSKDNYRMKKNGGKWSFPIFLNPGKYTYKYIVDGRWMVDPENELWEGDSKEKGNSVLWMEP